MTPDRAAALPRNRYDDVEWALILAGKCCELTSFGTGKAPAYCELPTPSGHVLCREHRDEFSAVHGYEPDSGGF